MKTIKCDCCRKKITDWTPDPHIRLSLVKKGDGLESTYDMCKKCANGISMIISGNLFIEKK